VVSLTDWPYRIIAGSGEEGAVELYDLVADPGEQENLAEGRPQTVAELRAKVEAYRAARPGTELAVKVDLDELQLQQLRALGYAVRR
jgi:hypothetical protein